MEEQKKNQKINDADINDTEEDIPDSATKMKSAGEGVIGAKPQISSRPRDMLSSGNNIQLKPPAMAIHKGAANNNEMAFEEEKKEIEAAI